MLVNCEECGKEVSSAALSCPSCGHPVAGVQNPPPVSSAQARSLPIFTIIAGAVLLLGLETPRILLSLPALVCIVVAVVAIFRKENPRWLPYVIAASMALLFILNAAYLSSLESGGGSNIEAAQIVEYNWTPDPSWGTKGTIHWNVSVKNISDKPEAQVKVQLTTFDKSDKLIASTFDFVEAIPPGETRSTNGFADYYGTEARAEVHISDVRFADQ